MENGIVITADTIIAFGSLIAAIIAIFGIIFAIYRWYLKQNKQDDEIIKLKKELALLTDGILACLKGLSEQGCDGPVTEAIGKIEEHLNQRAHE